jgi:enoyl-CoA hydratase/carnithine racemase
LKENGMVTTTGTHITTSVEESVATLTLNHPPVNALTPDLLAELEATLEALAADETVKVVVIKGAGRFFVAGADIRLLSQIPSSREGMEMALRGQEILDKIEALDKPVIAAINGACLGGGLELALCCHIRLAAEGARFGLPEINLGIMPGFGGTQRLPRLIGRSKATELILTGDVIPAQEARTLGLVSQVVPADELLRRAQGLARRIAAKGQVAVRAALQAIHQGYALGLHEGLTLEARLLGRLCETEDKKEGVAAFLEKRQPRFKDR